MDSDAGERKWHDQPGRIGSAGYWIDRESGKIEVKDGCIISMSGGEEAKRYEMWLKSFGHPQMLRISHAGIGFHPGAN